MDVHDLNINNNLSTDTIKTKTSIVVDGTTTITKEEIQTNTLKGNISTDYFQQGEEELIFDCGNSSN